jgi:hypothetical protein
MASLITSVSHGNYPQQPRAAYITTANYSNVLFNYTTSLNSQYVTVGSLTTPATGVNSSNTPAGDYLYQNGKKLYPGANPGISSFLVGVYSPVSGVSGYIDPNGPIFSPLQSGKPYQTQVQNTGGDYVYNADNSGSEDSGVPVLTNGSVNAGTTILATTGLGYNNNATSYSTGAQLTSVTSIVSSINTPTGLFTAFDQTTLASGAKNAFLMYNSSLGANDVLVTNISSSVTANIGVIGVNSYVVAASTALISIVNLGTGALTTADTPAIRFMTLKSL